MISRQSVVDALRTSVDTGTKQYRDFVRNVIDVRSHSIHDPIETLQNNVAICGQLYIESVQKLDVDIAEFLAHGIQTFPHSLSNFGKFNLSSTTSDLLLVSWAAWAKRATFDSRQQSHGWCRYRTLSVSKR